jgi:hypothetical protein
LIRGRTHSIPGRNRPARKNIFSGSAVPAFLRASEPPLPDASKSTLIVYTRLARPGLALFIAGMQRAGKNVEPVEQPLEPQRSFAKPALAGQKAFGVQGARSFQS